MSEDRIEGRMERPEVEATVIRDDKDDLLLVVLAGLVLGYLIGMVIVLVWFLVQQ